jgi:DNA-binding NarL/FixJ family response regulator
LIASAQRRAHRLRLHFEVEIDVASTLKVFGDMNKLRVLVAEDNEQLRRQLIRLLDFEFEVVGNVPNGQELVKAAVVLDPDVVVSDVLMPELTGPEAMAVLHAHGHQVPFVLISASSHAADEHISNGAIGFVHKIDIGSELSTAIRLAAMGRTYVSSSVRLL